VNSLNRALISIHSLICFLHWAQVRSLSAVVRFPIKHLVSRRTFVFARAGYGKSNLNKLLFSTLYSSECTVTKRNKEVPVGTIIFDPDGEYFWPDDRGNPGLCDVATLKDRIVVFASREAPSDFYGSFVAGGILFICCFICEYRLKTSKSPYGILTT
jgi:uncharacterized protein